MSITNPDMEVWTDSVTELVNNYGSLKADTTGIADRLAVMEDQLARVLKTQENMLELVASIKDQIAPVIDEVASGPIGKMLGIKGGKK